MEIIRQALCDRCGEVVDAHTRIEHDSDGLICLTCDENEQEEKYLAQYPKQQ